MSAGCSSPDFTVLLMLIYQAVMIGLLVFVAGQVKHRDR